MYFTYKFTMTATLQPFHFFSNPHLNIGQNSKLQNIKPSSGTKETLDKLFCKFRK